MQLTSNAILDAYRQYRCAFIAGAYGGGWRLPGRPNKCGNDAKTDDEKAFAVRAHNHAAEMLRTEVERFTMAHTTGQVVMGEETENLISSLTARIEPPKPPRPEVEVVNEAVDLARRVFIDGPQHVGPQAAADRLIQLQAEVARNDRRRRIDSAHGIPVFADEDG